MVTAIVMIRTEKSTIPETAEKIAGLEGVSSVYSVTGGWDLVAMVKLREYDDLADTIADQLSNAIIGFADGLTVPFALTAGLTA